MDVLRNIQCSGSESNLLDCSYSEGTACYHSYDTSIACGKCVLNFQCDIIMVLMFIEYNEMYTPTIYHVCRSPYICIRKPEGGKVSAEKFHEVQN